MTHGSGMQFTLELTGAETTDLAVIDFSLEEALSQPFTLKVRFASRDSSLSAGDYAGIDPVQQESAEFVQDEDRRDPAFFDADDWWWDHQRIRFLKSQIGLSIVLMAFPFFISVFCWHFLSFSHWQY